MAQGYYEMLGVNEDADGDEIRDAFQRRLAGLVRRLKAARKQGANVGVLEYQERSLREAMQVISDPVRRRRYDAFCRTINGTMPSDASELWDQCRTSLMDPATIAALNAVRALTELPIGDPIPGLPTPDALRKMRRGRPPAPSRPKGRGLQERSLSQGEVRAAMTVDSPGPAVLNEPPIHREIPPLGKRTPLIQPDEQPTEDNPETFARRYGFDGRFIKSVREWQRMSLEAMANVTSISQRHLEAIEGNELDRLPPATFVRGYVQQIAIELDIEQTDVVNGYMAMFRRHRG